MYIELGIRVSFLLLVGKECRHGQEGTCYGIPGLRLRVRVWGVSWEWRNGSLIRTVASTLYSPRQ